MIIAVLACVLTLDKPSQRQKVHESKIHQLHSLCHLTLTINSTNEVNILKFTSEMERVILVHASTDTSVSVFFYSGKGSWIHSCRKIKDQNMTLETMVSVCFKPFSSINSHSWEWNALNGLMSSECAGHTVCQNKSHAMKYMYFLRFHILD